VAHRVPFGGNRTFGENGCSEADLPLILRPYDSAATKQSMVDGDRGGPVICSPSTLIFK
jgi:hypothetical protein